MNRLLILATFLVPSWPLTQTQKVWRFCPIFSFETDPGRLPPGNKAGWSSKWLQLLRFQKQTHLEKPQWLVLLQHASLELRAVSDFAWLDWYYLECRISENCSSSLPHGIRAKWFSSQRQLLFSWLSPNLSSAARSLWTQPVGMPPSWAPSAPRCSAVEMKPKALVQETGSIEKSKTFQSIGLWRFGLFQDSFQRIPHFGT